MDEQYQSFFELYKTKFPEYIGSNIRWLTHEQYIIILSILPEDYKDEKTEYVNRLMCHTIFNIDDFDNTLKKCNVFAFPDDLYKCETGEILKAANYFENYDHNKLEKEYRKNKSEFYKNYGYSFCETYIDCFESLEDAYYSCCKYISDDVNKILISKFLPDVRKATEKYVRNYITSNKKMFYDTHSGLYEREYMVVILDEDDDFEFFRKSFNIKSKSHSFLYFDVKCKMKNPEVATSFVGPVIFTNTNDGIDEISITSDWGLKSDEEYDRIQLEYKMKILRCMTDNYNDDKPTLDKIDSVIENIHNMIITAMWGGEETTEECREILNKAMDKSKRLDFYKTYDSFYKDVITQNF